ncbi:hypothetical protein [Dokdonella soli]|uniref:hypothetical protein n=2 Tax=Dokdonella soli TaxID=529810 RepID=UPI00360C2C91
MRSTSPIKMLLLAAVLCSTSLSAAGSPPQDAPAAQPQPSICDRKGDSSPEGQWYAGLTHSLCRSGDADSLLAVYLISFPVFAAGEPDHGVLGRAYAIGKSNPRVLWTVAIDNNCQPVVECRGNQRAVDAAKALTRLDPGNAMAWFALAYAEDSYVTQPDEVSAALAAAAKAPRVHDYTFDLTKLVARATGRVPIPDAARDNGYGVIVAPENLRWPLVVIPSMLSPSFADWIKHDCRGDGNAPPAERRTLCSAAKAQLRHGDSLLTLSENPEATTALQASMQKALGKSTDASSKVMIDAVLHSSSEREMYAKAAAQLSQEK